MFKFDLSFRPLRLQLVWQKHTDECDVAIELRYATPLVCALVLLIAHMSGATTATAFLLIATLAIITLSLIWAQEMARHVRGARRLEARWIQVGDVLQERFTLSNTSALPLLWAEIADHSTVPGYNASTVRAANDKSQVHWTYSGSATRRGRFKLGPWTIKTSDPFGLFTVHIHYHSARPLLVYPPIAKLPFPALPRGASPGSFRINRAAPSPTVNAGQVRPYELGDPFRHIHWPSTARRNELIVKMFDQEASANVWLMVDSDPSVQLGQGDTATEEVSVIVAASLAADLLREGRAVGLVTHLPTQHTLRPARGTGHLWTLLEELAQLPNAADRLKLLEKGKSLPLAYTLNQIARTFRTQASLVIITPSSDSTWISSLAGLAWRQIAPVVILIDPAPKGKPSMQHLNTLLSEQGIATRTVRCDVPLPVQPALGKARRWEFKTLATGRVITVMEGVR